MAKTKKHKKSVKKAAKKITGKTAKKVSHKNKGNLELRRLVKKELKLKRHLQKAKEDKQSAVRLKQIEAEIELEK